MRVVVVGGGVIGLSIAWRCAAHGADVTVVDPAPGAGASWVAGGMLAPIAEAYQGEEALTALGMESSRRWPAFVAALADASGADPGYSTQGTLVIARDGDDAGELADLFIRQSAAGLVTERVSSREARRLEPALAPSIRGGLWIADDHQVDNRLLMRALAEACRRLSVGFVHESATMIGESTVTVASGVEVGADVIVVATGAKVPAVRAGDHTVDLPVRPVKGQIVRVLASPQAVSPTRTVRGTDVYVVPRLHGEVAIGATSEEKGFDVSVTAGAVLDLLRMAWELLPGLAEAEFLEVAAGSRPGTPDNAPLIGRLADGPVVALGHYRNGILLAPVTADAVVAMVFGAEGSEGGTVPEAGWNTLLAPFVPDRFTAVRV